MPQRDSRLDDEPMVAQGDTDAGDLVHDVVELPEHTEVLQDTEAADEMEVLRAPEEGRDRDEPQTERAMPAVALPRIRPGPVVVCDI